VISSNTAIRNFLLPGIVILVSLCIISCDDSVVFEQNSEIPDAIWSTTDEKVFDFDVQDTVTLHNLLINVRNGENYPYSNLFLFVELQFPNGKRSVDTLECYLADPSGEWIGTGLGDIYDSRFVYQKRKSFPLAGHYKIIIGQAMRVSELDGIYDVGFRLEKAQ
jgi:gliding motility-associated lipoprotein GldH